MESIIKNNAELQMSNNQQMKEIEAVRQVIAMFRSAIENFKGLFKNVRQHLSNRLQKKENWMR